jgi:glycosyltransferase involved in cell wall biosynthesis
MSFERKKPKVAIIWSYIPQYRQRFYELLKDYLEHMGIELALVYGQPSPKDAIKNDAIDLDWARKVHNTYINVGRWIFCWQPVLSLVRDADLVIVEMANKMLVNYIFLLQYYLGIKKIAFWGHGKNFQSKNADRFSEWIKRILSTKVYWWFAYNNTSSKIVKAMGFPESRVTIVQNTIDTNQLINELEKLKPEQMDQVRQEIGVIGEHIGLFVGGMYLEKRLAFLLDSLIFIREQIPDFEMIFIGSGTDAVLIKDMAKKHPWVHYLGPKFNNEKVPYFALSHLFLMPGLVGLAIIDCLATALPLITTKNSLHSPEIAYLRTGENGVIVDSNDDPKIYAQAVIDLLKNEDERLRLIEGCKASRSKYTIENMAVNFANGIQLALDT